MKIPCLCFAFFATVAVTALSSCVVVVPDAAESEDKEDGCFFNGERLEVGESVFQDSNTCVCEAEGQVVCTAVSCVDSGAGDSPCSPDAGTVQPDAAVPSCYYNGQSYQVGDEFSAGDDCNTCYCDASGEVYCTECICDCYYQGQTYLPGESFEAGDGCNSCWCTEYGDVQCTTAECNDAGPDAGYHVCYVDGVYYSHGDRVIRGCSSCICQLDGSLSCDTEEVRDSPCSSDAGVVGPDAVVPTCYYNGLTYELGEEFDAGDGCNICVCEADGEVNCTCCSCEGDASC